MTLESTKHPYEASDSWETYIERNQLSIDNVSGERSPLHRNLKHHRHHRTKSNQGDEIGMDNLELEKQQSYLEKQKLKSDKNTSKAAKKHAKRLKDVMAHSGIREDSVHGFMIDAGSTGSRLHVYEWAPRVLYDANDVHEAVSGRKLSFPGTESRWTDKLRPGLASFARLPDDELEKGIADYLSPLIEFAKAILHEKSEKFDNFPIFLRATAGMRTLGKEDRLRVLDTVRRLFSDNTYCPFYFENEYARILSGEEEAIFGWAGTNFLLGNLIRESEGTGTVINPSLTYGALDLGGASTQISFYEPNEEIMSNLFKLQIGQGKHWNVYAHSFLYFGVNEATNRLHARLLDGAKDATERLHSGVHNPCLPGGSRQDVRLDIHINSYGAESWEYDETKFEDGFYAGLLKNDNATADFDACMEYTKSLLNLEKNSWCEFAHRGDCSFSGVYQPEVPVQSTHFGEFLGFSNFYEVFNFLGLPERASLAELHSATQTVCSMSKEDIFEFNKNTGNTDEDEVEQYCFRSAYVFQLLRNGYGFELDEHITAMNVLHGQKVGWALGAMMYEINTFPWKYVEDKVPVGGGLRTHEHGLFGTFVGFVLAGIFLSLIAMMVQRNRRNRSYYEPIKEMNV